MAALNSLVIDKISFPAPTSQHMKVTYRLFKAWDHYAKHKDAASNVIEDAEDAINAINHNVLDEFVKKGLLYNPVNSPRYYIAL